MYHGIIAGQFDIPVNSEAGAQFYDLPEAGFREQLALLKEKGYPVLRVEEALAHTESDPVVITFDDGELNNFTRAFPILREMKIPAYFFITASRIGKPGYMGWEDLKKLLDADMIIGSHGFNHELLTGLNDKELHKELVESKAVLENHLQTRIDSFSVPRGFFDRSILQKIQDAGYSQVFVSEHQSVLPEGCWARTPVKGNWSLGRFEMALSGQVPVGERVFDAAKGLVKKMLGSEGYDRMRSRLLRKSDS